MDFAIIHLDRLRLDREIADIKQQLKDSETSLLNIKHMHLVYESELGKLLT